MKQLDKPEFDDIISKTRSKSPPATPAGFCLRLDSNVHFYAFAEFCGGNGLLKTLQKYDEELNLHRIAISVMFKKSFLRMG